MEYTLPKFQNSIVNMYTVKAAVRELRTVAFQSLSLWRRGSTVVSLRMSHIIDIHK